MGIRHSHQTLLPNDPTKDVSADEWNADHTVSLTKAELNTAVTDGNVQFVGDAPTAHTHPASEISDATAAGRAMVTAVDAAAQTALLDEFTPALSGLVPAGGLGGYFLSSDGVWTTTFLDNKFVLTDGTDPTKTGKFQVSGLTSGVQRQWTLPDADGTVALTGHTHIASNITDFAAAVAATAAVTANTAKVTNANHTGDVTGSTALTLATVNANVGSFGLTASVAQFVVNAKGLITSAANVAISIAATAISDSTAAGRAMLTAATAAAQTALLDVFASGAKGLVPASGGGTVNFLRADGTWNAPAGGGIAYPQVKAVAGVIAKLQNAEGAPGTTAATANQTRMYLYVPPYTQAYTAFGVNVTTAVAASLAKVAIYATDPTTGHPTALLGETADLDCSTTGFKSAALALTLNAGTVYALAVRPSSNQTLSMISRAVPLMARTAFSGGNEAYIQRNITYANPAPDPWVYAASEVQQFSFPFVVAGVI